MLRPRIIPFLMVHQGGLVKTVKFKDPKYIGDPLNAVKIFNEKEVDELIIVDIDATSNSREPDYDLLSKLARESSMPLCYGGGVNTPQQIEKIVGLGIEKVGISSAAISNPDLISESAKRVGSQSVVVILDVRKTGFINKQFELCTHNGKKAVKISPVEFARTAQGLGAGEILVNSIDKDGTTSGYDLTLAEQVRKIVNIPITILGGARDYSDLAELFARCGIIGAAAGSLFVFKGKYRAVLIQYPNPEEKLKIFSTYND